MPENYRPISIASIALRHFHRILAKRLEKLCLVDARQRAFRCADGVAVNIFVLNALLRDARAACRGLCLASLDLSKAFDSVSHESITSAMRGAGFVDYICGMHSRSDTFLQLARQNSRALRVTKGVRQGDPLSPLLFNLVLDTVLKAIDTEIGYLMGTAKINALAFADDVILGAETPHGLRRACEAFTGSLKNVADLRLNPRKSASLTQVPSGREAKLKVVTEVYSIDGESLPTLDVGSLWGYLGVEFVGGRMSEYDAGTYAAALERVKFVPMRPQFKLALVRDFLIPKLIHGLTFSVVSAGKLRRMSHDTRRVIRSLLDLPISCPDSYIHAPIKDGGLGVPDF